MPIEGPKPGNCCKSNTNYEKNCWRYYVCWVPSGCDPSYAWLEPGVACVYNGVVPSVPPSHIWQYSHVDIPVPIFRAAVFRKWATDTGGFWYGEVKAALLSGLTKDKLIDINSPVKPQEHFAFPLVPKFGPEDPDFLPQGMTFVGFNSRSGILADFPDCDLRMLPV